MTNYCLNCGTELPEVSKYCSKCGEPTEEESEKVIDVEVVPIPSRNKKERKTSPKKWLILLIFALLLMLFFWMVNRNPLKGHWISEDKATEIEITGKSAAMIFPEPSAGRTVSFEGPIKKSRQKEYLFAIEESKITVKFHGAADAQSDLMKYLEVIKDNFDDSEFSPSNKKIIEKTFDSVKKSGDDIIFNMEMKDYKKLLSEESTNFLELKDFVNFEFSLKTRGKNQMIVANSKNKKESVIYNKK